MSYAFSAIDKSDKEPDQPLGPGSGETIGPGGGGDIPVPEVVTFQLSGGKVMPFVPFPLNVTASKSGNYNGSLLLSFGDGGRINWEIRQEGSWSGSSKKYELGCDSVDPSQHSVKVVYFIDSEFPYSTSLSYSTGSMSVSMPSAMFAGKTYDFTVTYSGGPKCYASSLSSMKATLKAEGQVNGEWKTDGVSIALKGWSGGVQKGTLSLSSDFAGDAVRLCCNYAGKDSCATATVSEKDNVVFNGPDYLHVWGVSENMKITRKGSPVFSTTNSILEYRGGGGLDFSEPEWIGDVWDHDIQARDNFDSTFTAIVATTAGGATIAHEIAVDYDIRGDITYSPQTVYANQKFNVRGTVFDKFGKELIRIPNRMRIDAYEGEKSVWAELATVENPESTPYSLSYDVTIPRKGTFQFKLIDSMTETVIKFVTVTSIVNPSLGALAEAINERNLADGTVTDYTEDSPLEELRAGAVSCIVGFCLPTFDSEGRFTKVTSSYAESLFQAVPTEVSQQDAWIADTYDKVCDYYCLASEDYMANQRYKSGSGMTTREYKWDAESKKYVWTQSVAECKSICERQMNDEFSADWQSSSDGYVCGNEALYGDEEPGTYMGGMYSCGVIWTQLNISSTSKYAMDNFSRKFRFVANCTGRQRKFDSFGHDVQKGIHFLSKEISAGVGENFTETGWFFSNPPSTNLEWVTSYPSQVGYNLAGFHGLIEIGFKHR